MLLPERQTDRQTGCCFLNEVAVAAVERKKEKLVDLNPWGEMDDGNEKAREASSKKREN